MTVESLLVEERKNKLAVTNFTQWVEPLWETERNKIRGHFSESTESTEGDWGEISEEKKRLIVADLAHRFLPAAFILARYPAACLNFQSASSKNLEEWLLKEGYFPTQKSKRSQTARLIKETVEAWGNQPIGQPLEEFIKQEGFEKLWQKVCWQAGYDLEDKKPLQLVFSKEGEQKLIQALTDLLPSLKNLLPFFYNLSLIPKNNCQVLFERALAVHLRKNQHQVSLFYQPDMLVISPSQDDWQVGIWDLKLSHWQETAAWRYTLAFYQKVASALVRELRFKEENLNRLLANGQINLNLQNQVEPSAYSLLLFLTGEPVATRNLHGVGNLKIPLLADEEFWRLTEFLFQKHNLTLLGQRSSL